MAASAGRFCPHIRRRYRRWLQTPHGAFTRTRGPRQAHRARSSRRHQRVCKKPRRPALGSTGSRRTRAGTRPRLPHWLQGRRHGRDRQAARPRCGLPHQAAPRRRRHQTRARPPRQKGRCQHHRHRQRHRQPRDRGSRLGVHCRAGTRTAIHHRQRGRRVGVFRLRAREPGVSQSGCHRARRHELRPPPAGPAGRARQDSAPVHRRGPIPARP